MGRGLLARPWNADSNMSLRAQTDLTLGLLLPRDDPVTQKIVNVVEEIAKARGIPMAAIAVAWCLYKGVNPIVGLNSKARIDEVVQAVKVTLTKKEIAKLEEHYAPRKELPIY
jgi:aryl-alcohol dehydrogenase-like predicted oxidoreductase